MHSSRKIKGLISLWILIILGLLDSTSYCQTSFLDRITLRKSFQSKNDKAEPMVITYTRPEKKSESWLMNSAIGIDLAANTEKVLVMNMFVEYHKNTLVDKKQDNWQTGLNAEWQALDIFEKSWSPIIIANYNYNNNKIKKIESLQGYIYLTPLFKGRGLNPKFFWFPNTVVNFSNFIQFFYTPYIGYEREDRVTAQSDSLEGNINRVLMRLTPNISLFPASDRLKDKFEIGLDWQYRYNFKENVDALTDKEHKYLTISFNYTIFKTEKRSAKIGFDYVKGENPSKGFEKQAYSAITLKVKL